MSENGLYRTAYGQWAGNNAGRRPDYTKCCVEIFPSGRGELHHQCRKNRGFGPDKAYCKTHDPAAVKARSDAANAKWIKENNERRYGYYGRKFYDALKLIAEGHNDARGLAEELVKKFDEGANR